MKISSTQAIIFVVILLASLSTNFIQGTDLEEPKLLTSEEKLINGWAEGLIHRCAQIMAKNEKNNECLEEIKKEGYKIRTRDFWVKKGHLNPE